MAEGVAGKALYEFAGDLTQLRKDLATAKSEVQKAGTDAEAQAQQGLGKFSGMSTTAKVAVAGVGAAIGGIGGVALQMGQDYAKASNTLIQMTGASGAKLDGLKQSMTNIAGSVPEDLTKVADAVGTVSQRLDLTGPALDAASKGMLDYARLTGTDVVTATNNVADAMNRMQIPAEQLPGFLDKLTVAQQQTGIKSADLTAALQKVGPTLTDMGFTVDGSIATLAAWSKAGGDTSQLATGMNKAFQTFAKEGAPNAQAAFQMLVDKIKAAPDDMTAAGDAAAIFGKKIGTTMAQQIRNGTLDVGALTTKIDDATGTLDATTERTKTWDERFHEFFNGVTAQVGPYTAGIGQMGFAMEGFMKILGPVGAALGGLAGLMISGLQKLVGQAVPEALVAGTEVGAAIGEGEVEGSTGTSIVSKMVAGVAGLGIPMAAEGTTVGTTVGGAMGSGIIGAIGAVAVPLAVLVGSFLLFNKAVNDGAPAALANEEAQKKLADQTTATQAVVDSSGQALDAIAGQSIGDSAIMRAAWGSLAEEAVASGHTTADAVNTLRNDMGWSDAQINALTASANNAGQASTVAFTTGMAGAPAAIASAAEAVGTTAAQSVTTGFVAEAPGAGKAALDAYMGSLQSAWAGAHANDFAIALGKTIPKDIATGAIDNGTAMVSAGDRLIQLLKDGLSPAHEAMKLEGKNYTKAVAEGMKSEIPGAKTAAQQVAIGAITTIENAANGTPNTKGLKAIGSYYSSLLAGGMTAQQAAVALAAAGVSAAAIVSLTGYQPLYNAAGQAYDAHLALGVNANSGTVDTAVTTATDPLRNQPTQTWGYKVGDSWITGFTSAIAGGAGTIAHSIAKATAATHGQSPPKEGPLMEIDKWGQNIGRAWVEGLAKGLGDSSALVASLTPAGGGGGGGNMSVNVGGISVSVTGAADAQGTADAVGTRIQQVLSDVMAKAHAAAGTRWTTGQA